MTDNISRLYRLNNIDKVFYVSDDVFEDGYDLNSIKEDYPPFTDTKQLELIKWILENIYCIELSHNGREFEFYTYSSEIRTRDKDFSQALASFIYYKWDYLTPEQREEIKRILE